LKLPGNIGLTLPHGRVRPFRARPIIRLRYPSRLFREFLSQLIAAFSQHQASQECETHFEMKLVNAEHLESGEALLLSSTACHDAVPDLPAN
jgi:hypothetical protein